MRVDEVTGLGDAKPLEPTFLWPFLHFALIGWAAITIFKFLLESASLWGSGVRAMSAAGLLDFVASGCLLVGAILSVTFNVLNLALTVGGVTLLLYVVFSTWFSELGIRNSQLLAFLRALQHVWFPIFLAALITATGKSGDHERVSSIKKLLASQLPGLAGMCLLGAIARGLIYSDPFGLIVIAFFALTIIGSIMSCALSLAYAGTRLRILALWLTSIHIVYLIYLAAMYVVTNATDLPRYHPTNFVH